MSLIFLNCCPLWFYWHCFLKIPDTTVTASETSGIVGFISVSIFSVVLSEHERDQTFKMDSARACWKLYVAKSIRGLYANMQYYLSFRQHKGCGHFKALWSWQILVQFELMLQLQQLLTCECSSGSPALPKQVGLRLSWKWNQHQFSMSCNHILKQAYPPYFLTHLF